MRRSLRGIGDRTVSSRIATGLLVLIALVAVEAPARASPPPYDEAGTFGYGGYDPGGPGASTHTESADRHTGRLLVRAASADLSLGLPGLQRYGTGAVAEAHVIRVVNLAPGRYRFSATFSDLDASARAQGGGGAAGRNGVGIAFSGGGWFPTNELVSSGGAQSIIDGTDTRTIEFQLSQAGEVLVQATVIVQTAAGFTHAGVGSADIDAVVSDISVTRLA